MPLTPYFVTRTHCSLPAHNALQRMRNQAHITPCVSMVRRSLWQYGFSLAQKHYATFIVWNLWAKRVPRRLRCMALPPSRPTANPHCNRCARLSQFTILEVKNWLRKSVVSAKRAGTPLHHWNAPSVLVTALSPVGAKEHRALTR